MTRTEAQEEMLGLSPDELCYRARYAVLEIAARQQRGDATEEEADELLGSIERTAHAQRGEYGDD